MHLSWIYDAKIDIVKYCNIDKRNLKGCFMMQHKHDMNRLGKNRCSCNI